jgi:hypothetical protein
VFEVCVWLLQEYCFTGMEWYGDGNGIGNRLYDADSGWTDADRSLVCWSGRFGAMVWSLGICFGLVWLLDFFGFSTGAGGFIFWSSFFSIRRGDSGIGLDFSCTYTRLRSLAVFSFERY